MRLFYNLLFFINPFYDTKIKIEINLLLLLLSLILFHFTLLAYPPSSCIRLLAKSKYSVYFKN